MNSTLYHSCETSETDIIMICSDNLSDIKEAALISTSNTITRQEKKSGSESTMYLYKTDLRLSSPFGGGETIGKTHAPSNNTITTQMWKIEIKWMQTCNYKYNIYLYNPHLYIHPPLQKITIYSTHQQ